MEARGACRSVSSSVVRAGRFEEQRRLGLPLDLTRTDLEHPRRVCPAIGLTKRIDGLRTNIVFAQQGRSLDELFSRSAEISELQAQLGRALQPARPVRIRRHLQQRSRYDVLGLLKLPCAFEKIDGRRERLEIACREGCNAKPRIGGSRKIVALTLVDLREPPLEDELLFNIIGVHRLLLEHGRQLIETLLLLEQACEALPCLPIAAIDLDDQLPRVDRAVDVLQLALADRGDVAELRLPGVAR